VLKKLNFLKTCAREISLIKQMGTVMNKNTIKNPNDGVMVLERSIKKKVSEISWRLPSIISHLTDPPLYLAVAWWAYYNQSAVSRMEISRVFRITPQQAGDTMEYILRKRTDFIKSHRVTDHTTNERKIIVTDITSVSDEFKKSIASRKKVDKEKINNSKERQEELSSIRNRLISRKIGHKI
jgi:hypothetical protein